MRTVLVLDETVQTRFQFLNYGKSFPVCPVRSMISPRLSGRTAVQSFPRNAVEKESLTRVMRKLDRTRQLISRSQFEVEEFHPLDFFEYVIKCRLEYNPEFAAEFLKATSRNSR